MFCLKLISLKLQPLSWVVLFIPLCLIQYNLLAESSAEEYFIFQKNNKKGVRDSEDKVIIPAEYDDLGWSIGEFHPLDDVLGYKENGRWGLITLENKKI